MGAQIPPVPSPARPPLYPGEAYYLRVLVHWYKHRKVPPSLSDLQQIVRPWKSLTTIRSALLSLESKNYVLRNSEGKFEVLK